MGITFIGFFEFLIMSLEYNIFCSVIFGIWAVYFWEAYLHLRQYKLVKKYADYPTTILADIMAAEPFHKARLYSLDSSFFEFWSGVLNQFITTAVLVCGGLPYVWAVSVDSSHYFGFTSEYCHSGFFLLYTSLFNLVVSLPLSIYSTFVIEEKHGFNKQTPSFFAKDQVKKFIVGQFLMQPITLLLLWIIEVGGNMFFFWAWLFLFVVTIGMVFIYHDFIAPLFDKYTSLPDGELRTAIEGLCASHNFPLCKLLMVEGSKRSAHSNAYFYGFWKNKKIVLYDTLMAPSVLPTSEEKETSEVAGEKSDSEEKEHKENEVNDKDDETDSSKPKKGCTIPEILAVLGHELGHWSLWHTFKNLLLMQLNLLSNFALFAFLIEYGTLFSAFGFSRGESGEFPTIIRLGIAFQFILLPWHELIGFLMTALSRKFEFEADQYAVADGRGEELAAALIKLNHDNLGFPLCDWLYSTWNFSHPPLLERLSAIKKSAKKGQ